jgi:hypothetical protein
MGLNDVVREFRLKSAAMLVVAGTPARDSGTFVKQDQRISILIFAAVECSLPPLDAHRMGAFEREAKSTILNLPTTPCGNVTNFPFFPPPHVCPGVSLNLATSSPAEQLQGHAGLLYWLFRWRPTSGRRGERNEKMPAADSAESPSGETGRRARLRA